MTDGFMYFMFTILFGVLCFALGWIMGYSDRRCRDDR